MQLFTMFLGIFDLIRKVVNWSTETSEGTAAGLFIVVPRISTLVIMFSYFHIIWISKHGLRQVYEFSYKLYAGGAINGSNGVKIAKVTYYLHG
jgi:hypothetical protein